MLNCNISYCTSQGQYLIRQKNNYESVRQETEPNYFCLLEDILNFSLVITQKATVRTQHIQEKYKFSSVIYISIYMERRKNTQPFSAYTMWHQVYSTTV